MERRHRCELFFEHRFDAPVKLSGLEPASKERDTGNGSRVGQTIGRSLTFRDYDDRNWKLEKVVQYSLALGIGERSEIRNFGFAEDLNSLADESFDVPGERETRTRDVRAGNLTLESASFSQILELKRIAASLEKLRDRYASAQALTTGIGRGFRFEDFRVSRNLRIWAVSLSTAVASAGPKNRASPLATMSR